MYQYSQVQMEADDLSMDIEQYVTREAVFMKMGAWTKLNEEMRVLMMKSVEEVGYPERQLELYKSVQEALQVSETGEHYVIRAKLNSSQLKRFADTYMNQTNHRGERLMNDDTQVDMRKANIVYTVHKDNY
ncbi:hypothetical protein D3C77_604690 [compost metagenome]